VHTSVGLHIPGCFAQFVKDYTISTMRTSRTRIRATPFGQQAENRNHTTIVFRVDWTARWPSTSPKGFRPRSFGPAWWHQNIHLSVSVICLLRVFWAQTWLSAASSPSTASGSSAKPRGLTDARLVSEGITRTPRACRRPRNCAKQRRSYPLHRCQRISSCCGPRLRCGCCARSRDSRPHSSESASSSSLGYSVPPALRTLRQYIT
jgi:hypothetical protein